MKLTRSFHFRPGIMQFIAVLNVIFLLLIFFLLSSQAVVQQGLTVNPPYSMFMLAPLQRPHIITITAEPNPKIYVQSEQVTLDKLAEYLNTMGDENRSILIKADRNTSYDLVIKVSNICLGNGYTVALSASQSP